MLAGDEVIETPEEKEFRLKAESRIMRSEKQRRVARKIADVAAMKSVAGPGVPLLYANAKPRPSDNAVVEPILLDPMSHAKTGDRDVEINANQAKAWKRSANPPGPKVYFGPGAGFLNSQGGQSGIAQPRPVAGIGLPMGVNLRQSEKDFKSEAWVEQEDAMLEESTFRYGCNWQLASFEATAAGKHDALSRERKRSARQCLERWQELSRKKAALTTKVKQKDSEFKAMENYSFEELPGVLWKSLHSDEAAKYMLIEEEEKKWGEENNNNLSDDDRPITKRMRIGDDGSGVAGVGSNGSSAVASSSSSSSNEESTRQLVNSRLASLKSAATKRRKPPGIPGCQDPAVPIASVHASHSTASSAAAGSFPPDVVAPKKESLNTGDVWPLQLVDLLRQKAVATAAAAKAAAAAAEVAALVAAKEKKSPSNMPPKLGRASSGTALGGGAGNGAAGVGTPKAAFGQGGGSTPGSGGGGSSSGNIVPGSGGTTKVFGGASNGGFVGVTRTLQAAAPAQQQQQPVVQSSAQHQQSSASSPRPTTPLPSSLLLQPSSSAPSSTSAPTSSSSSSGQQQQQQPSALPPALQPVVYTTGLMSVPTFAENSESTAQQNAVMLLAKNAAAANKPN